MAIGLLLHLLTMGLDAEQCLTFLIICAVVYFIIVLPINALQDAIMVNLFCAISCIAWKVSRGSCAIPVQACGFHNLFCCTAYSTEGAVP